MIHIGVLINLLRSWFVAQCRRKEGMSPPRDWFLLQSARVGRQLLIRSSVYILLLHWRVLGIIHIWGKFKLLRIRLAITHIPLDLAGFVIASDRSVAISFPPYTPIAIAWYRLLHTPPSVFYYEISSNLVDDEHFFFSALPDCAHIEL